MKHKIISTTTKKKYIGNRTIATAYRIPAVSAKARRFSSIPKTLKIDAISVQTRCDITITVAIDAPSACAPSSTPAACPQ